MQINKNGLHFFVESKNYQEFWKNFSLWEQNDLNFVFENGEEDKNIFCTCPSMDEFKEDAA